MRSAGSTTLFVLGVLVAYVLTTAAAAVGLVLWAGQALAMLRGGGADCQQ